MFIIDCDLHLLGTPGAPLSISRSDLPGWAQPWLATKGAMAVRVAGGPREVSTGDEGVLLDGQPVARIGDSLSGGGMIVGGSDRIFVNGVPAAMVGSFTVSPQAIESAVAVGGPIVTYGPAAIAVDARLLAQAAAGSKRVEVEAERDGVPIGLGDVVVIDGGEANAETVVVEGEGSLLLAQELQFDHAAGATVWRVPDEFVADVLREPTQDEIVEAERLLEDGPPEPVGTPDGDSDAPIAAIAVAIVVLVVAGLLIARRRGAATESEGVPQGE
jgi:uncharacterized Zn-binding protein involved in type VI secretion